MSHDHRHDRTAAGVEPAIGGMTCASCAVRIEENLNRLDGVTATVDYAAEKASVTVAKGACAGRPDRSESSSGSRPRAVRSP